MCLNYLEFPPGGMWLPRNDACPAFSWAGTWYLYRTGSIMVLESYQVEEFKGAVQANYRTGTVRNVAEG
eukprot:scaffold353960_cov37-Prasinocladus_malaysianus.AAC.1